MKTRVRNMILQDCGPFEMANHLNQLELCGGRGEDQKFNFRMEGESLQKVFISTNLIDDLD